MFFSAVNMNTPFNRKEIRNAMNVSLILEKLLLVDI